MMKFLKALARTVQVLICIAVFLLGSLSLFGGSDLNHDGDSFNDSEAHRLMNVGLLLLFAAGVVAIAPDVIIDVIRSRKMANKQVETEKGG